jgi:hypothetical protein
MPQNSIGNTIGFTNILLAEKFELLNKIDIQITNTVCKLALKVPAIITASPADFRPESRNLLLS